MLILHLYVPSISFQLAYTESISQYVNNLNTNKIIFLSSQNPIQRRCLRRVFILKNLPYSAGSWSKFNSIFMNLWSKNLYNSMQI